MYCEVLIKNFLKKYQLNTHEYEIFSFFATHGPGSIDELAPFISSETRDNDVVFDDNSFSYVKEEECLIATESLIAKNILNITNQDIIDELKAILPSDEDTEAVEIPNLGEIELTIKGGKMAIELFKEVYGWNHKVMWGREINISSTQIRLFNTTVENIKQHINDCFGHVKKDIRKISCPNPIGPWWNRHWLRFPNGVTVDIDVCANFECL